MKKLFLSAAAAAMLLASCSNEVKVDDNPVGGGTPAEGQAYASFVLNSAPNTRAPGEFDPLGVAVNNAADKVISYEDLYLLVFKDDPTGVLEYSAKIDASGTGIVAGYTHTALLTAGPKKIFVLANMGSTTGHIIGNLVKTVGGTDDTGSAVNWSDLDKNGTPTITSLTDFYKIAFNAGTPQSWGVAKASANRTFSILPLSTRVAATSSTLGLPMSNSNQYSFTMTANITQQDAEDTTQSPSTSGTNAKNRFSITLDYLGAKARLTLASTLPQDTGNHLGGPVAEITSPSYTLKNLAKFTSLVQNVAVNGSNVDPRSYYHNVDWGNGTPAALQLLFDKHFDQASNLYTGSGSPNYQNGLAVPTAIGGDFIFVPENTNPLLLRGQSSFYAMHVTYKPQKIVQTVAFNPLANSGQGAVAFSAFNDWQSLSALVGAGRLEGGNKYYYYEAGILNGVSDATTGNASVIARTQFFANARVFADALWVKANNKALTDASYSAAAADALLAALTLGTDYLIFTDANSYYRLDIGTGDGDNANFGVLRGKAYTATITDIVGPGVPTEGELFDDPDQPVVAKAYGNVTITAADWTPMSQTGTVQ